VPGGAWTFLNSRRWIIFLLSSFFGGLGAISVASYLSPYLKELGANGNQIGFALTVAALTELPVFFFGHRLVRRFTPKRLFLIGLVLIGIRSVLFGVVNTIPLAILIQAVGGMFFPIMWSAGVAYADEHAPVGLKSTAQGLFGAASFGVGSTACSSFWESSFSLDWHWLKAFNDFCLRRLFPNSPPQTNHGVVIYHCEGAKTAKISFPSRRIKLDLRKTRIYSANPR
jgi:MFS family permease